MLSHFKRRLCHLSVRKRLHSRMVKKSTPLFSETSWLCFHDFCVFRVPPASASGSISKSAAFLRCRPAVATREILPSPLLGFNARIWHSNLSSFCMAIKGDVLCFKALLSFVSTVFHFWQHAAVSSCPDRSVLAGASESPGACLRHNVHNMTTIVGYHGCLRLSSGKRDLTAGRSRILSRPLREG